MALAISKHYDAVLEECLSKGEGVLHVECNPMHWEQIKTYFRNRKARDVTNKQHLDRLVFTEVLAENILQLTMTGTPKYLVENNLLPSTDVVNIKLA